MSFFLNNTMHAVKRNTVFQRINMTMNHVGFSGMVSC